VHSVNTSFNNSGTVNVTAGTLNISGNLTQSGLIEVESGAIFQKTGGFTNSGVLAGNGTIDVGTSYTLTNAGVISPGATSGDTTGTLSISGKFSQSNLGTLVMELNSLDTGDYDVLVVSGAATLGGTANFRGSATSGDFPFLSASSVSGSFVSQTGALTPILSYAADSVTAGVRASLELSWDGGGDDFLWTNALNWSSDTLPGSNDHVVVNQPGQTITLASGAYSIYSLLFDANFSFTGGSLNVATSAVFNGGYSQSAAATLIADSVTIHGTGNVALGPISSRDIAVTSAGNIALAGALNAIDGIVLTTGGGFSNSAGASAVSVSSGNWQIWSGNPANDTLNGLVPDFKQYNAEYGVTTPAQVSGNGLFYSVAPQLNVALVGPVSKTYDGTSNANLSQANFSLSGMLSGDVVNLNTPTSGLYADKNAGSSKSVSATGLSLGSASNGSTVVYGYQLASPTASGLVGDIAKANATVTANSGSGTYNGQTQTVSGFTASGLVNGESESVLTGITAGGSGKNAGSYATTASGTDGNYNLSFIDGNLVIAKANATVTANSGNLTYNGQTQTVSGFTASGLVNGESESVLTGVTAGGSGKNAGSYATTASGTDGNYTLSFVNGNLVIAKANATVTANSGSGTYNGQTQTVSGFTASGLVNGETESVLTGVTAGGSGKNAGSYATTASGTDGNYTLSFVNGNLVIAKANATVTANSGSGTYNGQTQTVSGFTASGLVNGESESVLTGVTAGGSGKNAGTYATTASGTDGNYTLSFIDGNLVIAKANATVTANSGNLTYNGQTQSISGFTASGLVNGESESVLTGVTAGGSGKNAGTYSTIASGTDSNYNLSFANGNLVIAKANATVTANSGNLTYNGQTQSVSGFIASGLVNGESESVLTGVTAGGSGKNAGSYSTIASGTDGNYNLSFVNGTFTISPLASVQWEGLGGDGLWSNPANWAGGALPDGGNVLSVSIPANATVTYDLATGSTLLDSLTSGGSLHVGTGTLQIAQALNSFNYNQSGGTVSAASLNVLNDYQQSGGSLNVAGLAKLARQGDLLLTSGIHAQSMELQATGAITQNGPMLLNSLVANAATGITLKDAGNQIGQFSASNGASGKIELVNTGVLSLGAISNTGDIRIDNTGAVTTNPLIRSSSGSVSIIAHSPLTIGSGGIEAGGGINLAAGASTGSGDNLLLNGNIASTGGGNVVLFAGDNLSQNANISSQGGNISLEAITGSITIAPTATTVSPGGRISLAALAGTINGPIPAGATVIQADAGAPSVVTQAVNEINDASDSLFDTGDHFEIHTLIGQSSSILLDDSSAVVADASSLLGLKDAGTSLIPAAMLVEAQRQANSSEGLSINPSMSLPAMGEMLKLRHDYKANLFKEALKILEQNSRAADLKTCQMEVSPNCMRVRSDRKTTRNQPAPKRAYLPQIQRKVAVLIGNNEYSGDIPKLKGAVPDVQALSEILKTRMGYEVRVIKDARKADIVDNLNKLVEEIDDNDSVAIYYAGHGYQEDKTRTGFWIPVDGKIDNPATWISNDDITRYLSNITAKQVMLISDSCYSGTFTKEAKVMVNGKLEPQEVLNGRSVVVMSSGGEEPVTDEGKENHSIFAWNLMQAMKQVEGWTQGSKLFDQVREEVVKAFPQTPQYGSSLAAGHMQGGDFLFEERQY
jgi:hypothetical protein